MEKILNFEKREIMEKTDFNSKLFKLTRVAEEYINCKEMGFRVPPPENDHADNRRSWYGRGELQERKYSRNFQIGERLGGRERKIALKLRLQI
ncbi:hypothetical protein AMTR_s00071p00136960 [Amborella trichopoda]|uniref:Uncharacterized protein n=1 Tax=Amborella trichopoda TaxID=13333 RepID=U5DCL9_AMBTC|nr:hypothetical protein AMTR_s00071p00136960 [Amborella trichopoda]